jgi:hypothetical protein
MIVATGRNQCVLNGCCTAMWKTCGKTATLLLLFPDRLSKNKKKMRDAFSVYKTYIQVFTKLRPFFGNSGFIIICPLESVSGSSSEKSDSSPHRQAYTSKTHSSTLHLLFFYPCFTVHLILFSLLVFQLMHNIYTFKTLNFYIKIYNCCFYMFWFPLKPSPGSSYFLLC